MTDNQSTVQWLVAMPELQEAYKRSQEDGPLTAKINFKNVSIETAMELMILLRKAGMEHRGYTDNTGAIKKPRFDEIIFKAR